MYRLDPQLHLPFLNVFFETDKQRIPEFITPLGHVIYSEENAVGQRVYLIINISSWKLGEDFRAEAKILATDEQKFRRYVDDPNAIFQYHHSYYGGNLVEYLKSELGPLGKDEIYFSEINYSSHPQPFEHLYKLKAEEYIAQLHRHFEKNPAIADDLYDLGNSEPDDLKVLKLYNGRSSSAFSCVNLRVFYSYGYGDPRTSFHHNTWFSKDFAALKDLNALSVKNNASLLPEALEMIQGFPFLVDLDLSDNQLHDVPPGLENLANLRRLALRHNNFKQMDGFLNLSQIEELSLANNAIDSIPKEIFKLARLQVLNLAGNNISELPVELLQLKDLRILNLSSNPLRVLPHWIDQFENLEELDLSQTQLESLPETFANLKVKSKVYLKKNPFKELPAGMLSINKSTIDLEERNVALYNPKVQKKLSKLPTGNVKMEADLNFKLMVIQRLMYEDEILLPKFDVYDFAENHKERQIDLEEISYEMIPEAREYFENLEIPLPLLWDIKELRASGGDEIYHQLIPQWDGEDDVFDVKSAQDVEHFPNLKKITLMGNNKEVVKYLRSRKIKVSFE